MVQGIGKNIVDGIIALIIVIVVLAIIIAVPIVGLSYEYAARTATHIPFWSGLTYFYTGLLTTSVGGVIVLLRRIF